MGWLWLHVPLEKASGCHQVRHSRGLAPVQIRIGHVGYSFALTLCRNAGFSRTTGRLPRPKENFGFLPLLCRSVYELFWADKFVSFFPLPTLSLRYVSCTHLARVFQSISVLFREAERHCFRPFLDIGLSRWHMWNWAGCLYSKCLRLATVLSGTIRLLDCDGRVNIRPRL